MSISAETREHLMKTRFKYLIFCAILQIPVGVSMIWGIFQPYIMSEMGWDVDTVSAIYPISVIFFVLGGIISGRMQSKMNPKMVIRIGGIVLAAGCAISALTTPTTPWVLYAAYILLAGTGYGIGYNQAIALSQKWFYDKRGFAGGVVVAALGVATMIATPVANWLFSTYGFRFTFFAMAGLFLVVNVGMSFFVKNPPEGFGITISAEKMTFSTKQYTPGEVVKTPQFFLVVLAMMCACISFYIINPVWVVMGQGKGVDMNILVAGMMVASLTNSLGRVVASTLSDKIGRRLTIMVLYVIIFFACLGMWKLPGIGIIPCFCLVCFCYGGFLATFPAITTDFFGVLHSGSNYGLVMSGMAIACLLALVVGGVFAKSGLPLDARCIPAAVIAVFGIIFAILLRPIKQKAEN